ncbi:hypothetical protein RJT34_19711 [Clitoria ternatea]|uniref:Uncharacterized protein n=1 Tax=Clitoria ternatea TaxID=43366 RepID=A0AAN9P461_CLITE
MVSNPSSSLSLFITYFFPSRQGFILIIVLLYQSLSKLLIGGTTTLLHQYLTTLSIFRKQDLQQVRSYYGRNVGAYDGAISGQGDGPDDVLHTLVASASHQTPMATFPEA